MLFALHTANNFGGELGHSYGLAYVMCCGLESVFPGPGNALSRGKSIPKKCTKDFWDFQDFLWDF